MVYERAFPVSQWHIPSKLAAYSCGGSFGFAPNSLITYAGKVHVHRQSVLMVARVLPLIKRVLQKNADRKDALFLIS
jgi:hypothetical protein